MDVSELMQVFLEGSSAERLGHEVGLGAADAERVLREGVPLQLNALAGQARTPEGQTQIAEAINTLPVFPSVGAALDEPDGATHLQQAGELLTPALLGAEASGLASRVAGGLDPSSVGRLLSMTLPLLLSFLGQRGVNADTIGAVLPGLKGGGTGETVGAALTPASLIEFLRGQFSPSVAEQVGRAAGYTGNTATRAAQAALPILLNGLVSRAGSGEGAAELLARSRDYARFTDTNGHLNTALLADQAEVARIEGQGRNLLGSLFANMNAVTGRLGSALGGSGTNAGRLLALLAPLVTGLVLGRARAGNLDAAGLAGLLGGLRGNLEGMLPQGLSSLGALLRPATVETVVVATPEVTRTPAPTATPAPTPAQPVIPLPSPPAATTVTSTTNTRRRGFPWWLIPLLLLLGLGGCWVLQNRPASTPALNTTTGAAASQGIVISSPTSGATLPAEDFVMSGTGPAGETLSIEDEGQQVASVNVRTDGTWEAAIPAPTPGEHTYTVQGQDGARSEFKVNVTGQGNPGGANGTASTTPPARTQPGGTFAIQEPGANAELPAGGFTLRGTGTPGQTLQVFEDGTSLGNVTVAEDGSWSLNVPSPAAGEHTYTVQGPDGSELGRVAATIAAASANASASSCTREFTLSITDGQTVSQPFRFGGEGQGQGYSVTVKRGERTVGTKNIRLDATCGWSYQSRPGVGQVTYEVRPLGEADAEPLNTVTLTVQP